MRLPAHRFYLIYSGFLATVLMWTLIQAFDLMPGSLSICIFKNITGYSCPGCGTTRAGMAFLNGNFAQALLINPIGVVISILLAASGIIFLSDFITGKSILLSFAQKLETGLKKPQIIIPLLLIILINWCWTLTKGI